MAPALVGPPSVRNLVHNSTEKGITDIPQLGRTENNSATWLNTGNPCLDFFFHVVPDTPSKELIKSLEKAWAHHPLTTLKLICNLRGVRGTGKSDKKGFYTSALWLHKHHPRTLSCNVSSISEFGYFKDFLEILYMLLYGEEVRNSEKKEAVEKSLKRKREKIGRKLIKSTGNREKVLALRSEKRMEKAKKALDRYSHDPEYRFLHERVSDFFAEILKSDMKSLNQGELKNISLAAKWCPSTNSSFDKATLICETIARKLFPRDEYMEYSDIEDAHYSYRTRKRLQKEVLVPLRETLKLPEVYMCANKWNEIAFNRVASVAMKTYKKLFYKHDKERFEEYLEKVKSKKSTIAAGALLPHEIIESLGDKGGAEVAELQWKRMVDDMSQKGKLSNCMAICDVSGSMSGTPMEVCVALGLLISELSEEPWKGKIITFSEKPRLHIVEGDSLKNKTKFIRRMDWGMNTDFQKVFDLILEVAVKAKITPDQMIKRLFVFSDMEFDQAVVSNSSNTSSDSSDEDDSSDSSDEDIKVPNTMPNSNSSDSSSDSSSYRSAKDKFIVSKTMLNRYNNDSSSESESDSCDEDATPNMPKGWDTDYEVIKKKFEANGYGNVVPEIVFWNLRNSKATPVPSDRKGVALVSGFSKNLMKVFMEEGRIENPIDTMMKAISGEEYQKLLVFD